MKPTLFALVAAVLSSSALLADFTTPFASPPYTLDASIIGLEGWESRLKTFSDDGTSARLVAVRWDEYRPALLLYGASIRNDFPSTTSSKVRVTVRIAFTFPTPGPHLLQTRILIQNAPFGEIAFKCHPGGGLGFGDGTPQLKKILAPIEQVRINAYYTLTIDVDYDAATYDVAVTGLKRDGSPLSVEEKGIAFETKGGALKGLDLITASSARTYIQQLRIESL